MKTSPFLSKKIVVLLLLVFFTTALTAQVGIGTTNPNPDALLDIDATTTLGGLLLPRVALTSTSSPAPLSADVVGMTVYNTATIADVVPGYYYNDGSVWHRLITNANDRWSMTGNTGSNPGTNFVGTADNIDLNIRTNNINRMNITNLGLVGINSLSPLLARLHLLEDTDVRGPFFAEVTNPASNWVAIEGFNPNIGIGGAGIYGAGNTGVVGDGFVGVEGYTVDLVLGWSGFFNGDVGVTQTLFATNVLIVSDKRVKKNIRTIDNALGKLLALSPSLYEKKVEFDKNESDRGFNTISKDKNLPTAREGENNTEYGLIAQELELILPELVFEKKTSLENLGEIDLKSVNYTGLIPILIQGIQDQQEIIEDQETRIAKLEALVENLISKQ